ncbi:MAG: serine/threonine protein kinase [Hyphomicrobiales bacterium]|nr:MAG: serine/threonine protein kinase [Hyphomicrobiales bacterium]
MAGETIHACAVVIGADGVLIRGPSGAGKSTLAARLIAEAARNGTFARLVADDRVELDARNGRVVARVPETIAGYAEVRGRGILPTTCEPAAVVRLVVDIIPVDALQRMPETGDFAAEIAGVSLARQPVSGCGAEALALIGHALRDNRPVL